MGCSIHIISEIKRNGKWESIPEIPKSIDTRDYSMFGFIADTRNYFNYTGFKAKGLPDDLSAKKFYFESARTFAKRMYAENTKKMFIAADGTRRTVSEVECKVAISKEEYNRLQQLGRDDNEAYSRRYDALCQYYPGTGEGYEYYVYDASSVGGHYEQVPIRELYDNFESYLASEYADEYDDDAKDYGSWGVDFDCEDYHTHSYLTLKELVEKDLSDYTATKYRMDREFYNAFINAGGVLPEIFTVKGDTEPGDMIDCFREALQPTVIVSWQKSDEEIAKLSLVKGIAEMKEIAEKYNIVDYNDIRIVFAFDN